MKRKNKNRHNQDDNHKDIKCSDFDHFGHSRAKPEGDTKDISEGVRKFKR